MFNHCSYFPESNTTYAPPLFVGPHVTPRKGFWMIKFSKICFYFSKILKIREIFFKSANSCFLFYDVFKEKMFTNEIEARPKAWLTIFLIRNLHWMKDYACLSTSFSAPRISKIKLTFYRNKKKIWSFNSTWPEVTTFVLNIVILECLISICSAGSYKFEDK